MTTEQTPTGAAMLETELAAAQKQHLVKTLGRFDMIFFTVAVIVGLDLIGQAASNGYEAITWTVALVVLFLVPYGLVMAEVGAAFTGEGGPYEWVKLAMGRAWAGFNTMLYWITNPLWVGGSLAFTASAAWSVGISHIGTGSVADYVLKMIFIWVSILSAIISFRVGKWIPTVGAILKVALVGFFAITAIVYAIKHGVQGGIASGLSPTTSGFLAIVPLILFSFVGFEGQNGAGDEMQDPQRDVPVSILRSGALSAFCYLVPIVLVLLVLPLKQITGLGGFVDAIHSTYQGVYGGATSVMFGITCVLFILTLMNSGASWMMCGDRVLAVAAADGGFAPFFGPFHPRLGTPLRANLLSGVIATVFSVIATILVNSSGFAVVLTMAISTTLLSYILIFPSVYILRRRLPHVPRPFRVTGRGSGPLLGAVSIITFWVLLGSWTSVFPGTLDRLFGQSYSFVDEWSVSQGKFELFTLGTLGAITLLWIIGYATGAAVRRTEVTVSLGDDGVLPSTA
jgi:amino acid transporter